MMMTSMTVTTTTWDYFGDEAYGKRHHWVKFVSAHHYRAESSTGRVMKTLTATCLVNPNVNHYRCYLAGSATVVYLVKGLVFRSRRDGLVCCRGFVCE